MNDHERQQHQGLSVQGPHGHPTGKIPLAAMIRRDWKNPPNLVTAIRFVGSLVLPFFIISTSLVLNWWGFALFVILAASDKLDGWLAKRVYGSTDLGKMLDAIVDKALIFITLMSLLASTWSSGDHAMTLAIIGATVSIGIRETVVARVKVRAQRRSNQIDSAIQSSRITMVLESVALAAQLIPIASPMMYTFKLFLLGLAVGASLLSGRDYYLQYR